MQKETWIIVANSTHARIFRLENLQLIELDALIHPEGRIHEKDLIADKPGVTRGGPGTYGMEQQKSPKKIEAVNFAKLVADSLDSARAKGQIDRLFVAAAPSFLGLLRQEMTQLLTNMVDVEVAKDITGLKPEEILGYFPIGL